MLPKTLKGARILILIGGHLATAPRPLKEAMALRAEGADVAMRGVWWHADLAREDVQLAARGGFDFAPVLDLRPGGRNRLFLRLRQRVARECFSGLGLVTPRVFGSGGPELLREARRIGADLTMVHSEAGLWVGNQLLADGRRVGVDFEDWFSQDLTPEDRKGRPVDALQALERHLLRHAHGCLTTSHALADALARDAGTSRLPVVVSNCFPAADRAAAALGKRDAKPEGVVSFHWFSQTIGPGRGLEILAQALPLVRGAWQVTLRGSLRGHRDWFDKTFPEPLRSRIKCLDAVPNSELLARTMSHDVGLALEQPYCLNKELTASNKIFEYMRAGLAVIATCTRGQEEVMCATAGVGVLIPPEDPAALADAMQRLIDDPRHLQDCRNAAAAAAQGLWAWERHSGTLISAIAAMLPSVND